MRLIEKQKETSDVMRRMYGTVRTYDIGTAQYYSLFALNLYTRAIQEFDATLWGETKECQVLSYKRSQKIVR